MDHLNAACDFAQSRSPRSRASEHVGQRSHACSRWQRQKFVAPPCAEVQASSEISANVCSLNSTSNPDCLN